MYPQLEPGFSYDAYFFLSGAKIVPIKSKEYWFDSLIHLVVKVWDKH